ncbi:MAG: hypothetical protein P1U63_13130 [Coxiellaceae bacterium]|nr:hypothetical protein [Coxiellaceae bacterium]
MNHRGYIIACALSVATLAVGTATAGQAVFEVGVQASYFTTNGHGHSNHLFLTLNNINNETDASSCTSGANVPMPLRAPRLRIEASPRHKLQFTLFHSDGKGICLQPGLSSATYLIPGVTDQQPLLVPHNLKSNRNLTYVFITFNDQHSHLSQSAYQVANNNAQALCQKAISNARPSVISGTCYPIPKFNTSRNAGYYAVMAQAAS